jgi:predicted metal-dependent hydrolase
MFEEIPEEFWQGVEQFNRQEFYTCHDTLEALWMEAAEPDRTFYQGVLQIAVALHHLGNQNWRGAMILLGEGVNRLRRYQPSYFEIDVSRLMDQSLELLTQLQQAGPEKLSEFVSLSAQGETSEELRFASSPLALPKILKVTESLNF